MHPDLRARSFLAPLLVGLGLLLGGCDGTIEGPGDDPPPLVNVNQPADSPVTAGLSADEQRLLDLVNADRARLGGSCPGPLVVDLTASQVARRHSQWMADTGTLSHDDPDGDPFTRLQNAGVAFTAAGENAGCGGGCASVDEAEAQFLSQGPGEGHYDNIVDCNWTHIGIGVAQDASGRHWVTQDFLRLP